jgi:thiamine biosynthesis protein ThiI
VVALLSGGIDSPVAAWCALKRGCHVTFVSFHSSPYLGETAREKVRRLAAILARWQRAARLYSVPFARIQEAIRERCAESYRTVLYRRMMQRIAARIAREEHAAALVTGESIGQVASQTLENLHCIEEASDLPVLRPLVTNDKHETIALARRIGTFDVSSQSEPDCCTLFQPAEPVIHGRVWRCQQEEALLDVETLVQAAVAGAELERFLVH